MADDVARRPGETTAEWVKRMTALTAVDEAEFYAAGGRRLTIHHGPSYRLPRPVTDAIDRAAARAGYVGGGICGTSGPADARRTTWSYPATCGGDPAAIVATTRDVARRLNPGTWTIDADDY